MHHEFRFTDIGEGLEEGEIVAWFVEIGDRVVRDQPIVEVLTDKSNAELPAPCDGVVVSLGGEVGEVVHVGHVLAVIDDEAPTDGGGEGSGNATFFQQAAQVDQPSTGSGDGHPGRSDTGGAPTPLPRVKAAPSTRREAARRGIDLTTIVGTGPGGRILLSDLDGESPSVATAQPTDDADAGAGHDDQPAAATVAAPIAPLDTPAAVSPAPSVSDEAPVVRVLAPPPVSDRDMATPAVSVPDVSAEPPKDRPSAMRDGDRHLPLRGIRRAVARNMAQSWSEIPHIHVIEEIDAEPMLALRHQLRTSSVDAFERLTPLSLFVAAVARAMRRHPMANASLDLANEQIIQHDTVDVGVAVAASHGLVVPVLREADRLALDGVSGALANLVDGARVGSLSPATYRDGTVTVTNFGSLGASTALPLIRPPESVIFGFGAVAKRPWVHDDAVVARQTMHVVIGTDHRLLDGDVTTSLLLDVCSQLSAPARLLLPPGA